MVKLTKSQIDKIKEPGKFGDGGGLWLIVRSAADSQIRKSWSYRFTLGGKVREMGIGAYPDVLPAEAREKALRARKLVAASIDPLAERNSAQAAAAARVTFRQAYEAYWERHRSTWQGQNTARSWISTAEMYAFPVLRDLFVNDITTQDVLRVVTPIWEETPGTFFPRRRDTRPSEHSSVRQHEGSVCRVARHPERRARRTWSGDV